MARVVLIVEDNRLVLNQIAEAFRKNRWLVLEAHRGELAIDSFRKNRVDLVLTDIKLPGSMTGWDVADAWRATRPDGLVVYTSGDAVDRSRQVEGSLFFEKPYDPDVVVQACTALMPD
jgi:DNA-binding response OmpR family regulator